MGGLTVLYLGILAIFAAAVAQEFDHKEFQDLLQIGGNVRVKQIFNSRSARSQKNTFEDEVENFIKTNELSMEAPFSSTLTFNGQNLENGEIDLKLHLGSGNEAEARKKSKVKKVLAPILIVLLLKAITLIPLALGILGIKTWNALQLSFVSFVTSIVLAVWKLCAKFSDHHHAPHVIHEAVHDVPVPHVYHESHHDHHLAHHDHHHDHHHDPWDHPYHRSDDPAQQAAYSGYVPESRM